MYYVQFAFFFVRRFASISHFISFLWRWFLLEVEWASCAVGFNCIFFFDFLFQYSAKAAANSKYFIQLSCVGCTTYRLAYEARQQFIYTDIEMRQWLRRRPDLWLVCDHYYCIFFPTFANASFSFVSAIFHFCTFNLCKVVPCQCNFLEHIFIVDKFTLSIRQWLKKNYILIPLQSASHLLRAKQLRLINANKYCKTIIIKCRTAVCMSEKTRVSVRWMYSNKLTLII